MADDGSMWTKMAKAGYLGTQAQYVAKKDGKMSPWEAHTPAKEKQLSDETQASHDAMVAKNRLSQNDD